MIYVTHDQVEAMTLAERIVILREGVIEQIGRPQTLYNDPDNIIVGGFIGSPKMNLLKSRKPGAPGANFLEGFMIRILTSRKEHYRDTQISPVASAIAVTRHVRCLCILPQPQFNLISWQSTPGMAFDCRQTFVKLTRQQNVAVRENLAKQPKQSMTLHAFVFSQFAKSCVSSERNRFVYVSQ